MNSVKLLMLASSVSVFAGCQSWQYRDLGDLDAPAALPDVSEQGKVQVWYYDGVTGTNVTDLTANPAFPDSPSQVAEITSLNLPASRGDSYGSLVRGYITAPASGDFRFMVSGDDETQFWLSTSTSVSDKALVATVPGYTGPQNYTKYSSQVSSYITLEAGKRYYFEVLFKEGSGGDHFTVAWEGPGIGQQIIDGNYLSTYAKSQFEDSSAQEAYSLGYRVGYLDGTGNLAFNQSFPPLDEDLDGIYDNWEVVNGLDPTNAGDATTDPDGDFLTAADEFLLGTRENNPDSDGDGIPDGTEFAYQLDPLDAKDASEDADNDGFSNLEEYQANTEIDNPESSPETVTQEFAGGFVGQYFSGMEFDQFIASRSQETVDYAWKQTSPFSPVPENQFSVRWTGIFTAPHSSGQRDYVFAVRADDGVRVMLGNNTVINGWIDQAPTTYEHQASLSAGTTVPITIEYYENARGATAQFSITDASTGDVLTQSSAVQSPDLSVTGNQDSDGDSIPDYWELKYGTNMLLNDAATAYNASGVTAIEAYQSELHPWTLEDVSGTSDSSDGGTVVPPSDTVNLTWTAPSTRTDGSSLSLSEISHYLISYGQSEANLDNNVQVSGEQTSYSLEGLNSGTWYFSIQVVDTDGLASNPSDPVSYQVN
ncbi:PA14 domain-containing protein [Marinobacter sp. SS21]|uniref:PA14 domain-containing protein n=1 Tax=Marinobacter sp. SS21 TaxID=2979460 RepID=UPI00232B09DB|nr:PA14 domain-containing protein [Marinobacter sp. SS21]MDC0661934.1 PA14 domain-containing protein [Marinobacter sp. SS21]